MRALFVGLGSIGTRHLKNLTALCAQKGIPLEAEALRSSARQLPPETAALLSAQHTALPETGRWDAAFITNPTHLHAAALEELRGAWEEEEGSTHFPMNRCAAPMRRPSPRDRPPPPGGTAAAPGPGR